MAVVSEVTYGSVVSRTLSIDHVEETVSYPGVATLEFEYCAALRTVVNRLAAQVVSDGDADTEAEILRTDGSTRLTVSAAVDAGPPVTVSTVSPGSVAHATVDAIDLIAGLVLAGVLAPLP